MPKELFRLNYRAKMLTTDEGEIALYGEIVNDMPKYYKEQFPEDKSAADFKKAVEEMKRKGVKKLLLRINSPGGIVYQAVAMRGILTGAGFDAIRIRIEGLCASAATLLATIPDADVEITKGSEYMIHNPWTYAYGNAGDLEHEAAHLRQIEDTSRGFYAAKCGHEDEEIQNWMDEETWFSAEDAVKNGFCDRVADEGALPAAACVTGETFAAMKALYRNTPENITISNGDTTPPEINESEEEEETMDIKEITLEQLQAGNPELLDSIRQEALTAERARCDEIDALTDAGCEEMAEEAKRTGMSANDFLKKIVAMRRKKGAEFLSDRAKETEPAEKVGGGDPMEHTPEQEIGSMAKDIAAYAAQENGGNMGGMY